MPSSKEQMALWWAQASDEEKNEKRRRHAEAQRRYRAKKGKQERSKMNSDDIAWKRALDKKHQRKRRNNLTNEEKETIRKKDKESKKKKRIEKKNKQNMKSKADLSQDMKFGDIDLHTLEENKIKQRAKNCRIKRKIRDKMTDEEKEKNHVDKVKQRRQKLLVMTIEGKLLAGIKAKEGMKLCRRFGYLRKYKQRKLRDEYDPSKYVRLGVNKNGYSSRSWYYIRKHKKDGRKLRKKQNTAPKVSKKEFIEKSKTGLDRKDELKRMNRMRVKKHRMRIKKCLQEPVIIDECSKKGEYELLREKNIRELERLKKKSGLFD